MSRTDLRQHTYIMLREDGVVKIGRTKNLPRRQRELELKCGQRFSLIYATIKTWGANGIEYGACEDLKNFRVDHRKEWFRVDPDLAIEAVIWTHKIVTPPGTPDINLSDLCSYAKKTKKETSPTT